MGGFGPPLMGGLVMASVIFPEPMWGLDRGWREYVSCRVRLKDGALCRHLVEGTFERQFPSIKYDWPDCGKDDVAEAILWAAVSDRGWVDRYMEQLRRLCR